ncbi:MAG: ZapG family protein [Marinomonas foliarum]|uniref:ZapG family protein n=1 Tax=Marinomonas foliarum TaxID=491950 RepID=UPI003F9A8E1C
MNLEEFNIIIFITGIIIGCVATLFVKSLNTRQNKQTMSNSSVITIKSLQQELDSKQVIIDNFFTDSNEHLIAAEKRLAELRNCLASNAPQLSNVKIESHQTTTSVLTDDSEITEAPRDYALKKDKEPGMLSESFGLDDRNRDSDLEPKRTI